jgi:hypothetical protein
MPRVHFDVFSTRPEGFHEVVVIRPVGAPKGYTPISLLTEWLTLNCRGDWSSRARKHGVVLRFAAAADYRRAVRNLPVRPAQA